MPYQAVHIEVIEWSAAQCLPSGSLSSDRAEAFELFVNDVLDAYGRGARFLATVPLVEPGAALLLVAVENEAVGELREVASVGEVLVDSEVDVTDVA
jgi:hypothetical protein